MKSRDKLFILRYDHSTDWLNIYVKMIHAVCIYSELVMDTKPLSL